MPTDEPLTFERLAYWYLRLNGFLVLSNVMIHPETGRNTHGEIDVLGVRFPHRSELLINSMRDDPNLSGFDKPLIVLGEVKTGRADVNETWRSPMKRNMERILRLLGVFPLNRISEVATAVYTEGFYADEQYYLKVAAFGASTNTSLATTHPAIIQITWLDISAFVYSRFKQHRNAKFYHNQWDSSGHALWDLYQQHSKDAGAFHRALMLRCGLREAA